MATVPKGYELFSTLSQPQQQIFGDVSQRLMSQLGGSGIEQLQAPYLRQFREQIVPQLAEQFAGFGAGSQSSSAFQQALGQSGAGLAENLASLGIGREQNALQSLQNLLGLQTQGLVKKELPWWQQGLVGLSGGIGQGIGQSLGGGIGGGASSLLSALLGLFGKKSSNAQVG